jgi:hypothetical protein
MHDSCADLGYTRYFIADSSAEKRDIRGLVCTVERGESARNKRLIYAMAHKDPNMGAFCLGYAVPLFSSAQIRLLRQIQKVTQN